MWGANAISAVSVGSVGTEGRVGTEVTAELFGDTGSGACRRVSAAGVGIVRDGAGSGAGRRVWALGGGISSISSSR